MHRHCRILSFLLTADFLLTACSALPVIGKAEQPTRMPTGAIIFTDDFSNVPNGWGISESSAAAVNYEREGLRILVGQSNTDAWSLAGKRFADAHLEVTAVKQDGPENNLIGLVCRYQDRGHFYLLFISSDGYYGIARYSEDSYTMIGADQLQYASVILREKQEYRLKADCDGDRLTLFVDDWRLQSVQDEAYSEGDVGVFAGVYAEPGVDILFDDFLVSQP